MDENYNCFIHDRNGKTLSQETWKSIAVIHRGR